MPWQPLIALMLGFNPEELRLERLEQMRMDDDGMGQMHPTYADPWPQLWREYMDHRIELLDSKGWPRL